MKQNESPMLFHQLLAEIVQEFGEEVLTETRLRGIISDMGAGSGIVRFRTVIDRSISNHIGQKMLLMRDLDDADFFLRVNTLKQTFQEENFFRHGIADYIIDSYLYALGWIDDLEEYNETEDIGVSGKRGELSFAERGDAEYCGNLNKDDERSGFGVCKREDGSYYAGEWKLDMKNGIGIDVSANRNRYAGEWRMNRRNGIGIQIQEDGTRYSGEWKNGKMHGVGTLFYPNGECMCVRFLNGKIQEDMGGTYYLQDGTYVVGRMTMNGPEGLCFHWRKGGVCEEENWKCGIKCI